MKGDQPEAWESERRQAAVWCVQFNGDGWIRLPPLVEDKLEHAHQNHDTDLTLEVSSLFPRLPVVLTSATLLGYSQFRVIRGCHVKGARVKIWCFSLREQGFNPQKHTAATQLSAFPC